MLITRISTIIHYPTDSIVKAVRRHGVLFLLTAHSLQANVNIKKTISKQGSEVCIDKYYGIPTRISFEMGKSKIILATFGIMRINIHYQLKWELIITEQKLHLNYTLLLKVITLHTNGN